MSNFDAWLRDCAAAGWGGARLPQLAIVRGHAYRRTIGVPVDVSADTFTGSLRMEPDSAGAVLADFTVTAGSYTGGVTPITLSLSASATAALPPDGDADGTVDLAFDILRQVGGSGDPYRFIAGILPVSGKVTNV